MKKSIRFHSTHKIVSVNWLDSMESAYQKMSSLGSRHLPVIDDVGAVVGMLSDRDVQRAMIPQQALSASVLGPTCQFESGCLVRDYMSWPLETINEFQTIADAARVMLDKKISSLVVLRESMAVGVVTTDDLLLALIEESESLPQTLIEGVTSAFYRSPVGGIAQNLANAGL